MIEIFEGEEIPKEKWGSMIPDSIHASPFQTTEFCNTINSIPGYSADTYAVGDESQIKALCVVTLQREPGLKGFFSRRAIIYGGPLLKEVEEKEFEKIIKTIETATSKRAIYTEIRNLSSYSDYDEIYKRNKWNYLPYQNFIVDCRDKDSLWNKMGNNRRRQIRKALEAGVKIKVAENQEEVKHFYTMLRKLYDKKVGKPLPPEEYFYRFFRSDSVKFLLVRFNDIIIGGIMVQILAGRSIYEIYVTGEDDEYKDQYPSVMATWAAIDYANKNHIPFFDFMGAGRKDLDYGVREFKSRFGGELVEYGRYVKINKPLLYSIGKAGLRLMKLIKK